MRSGLSSAEGCTGGRRVRCPQRRLVPARWRVRGPQRMVPQHVTPLTIVSDDIGRSRLSAADHATSSVENNAIGSISQQRHTVRGHTDQVALDPGALRKKLG